MIVVLSVKNNVQDACFQCQIQGCVLWETMTCHLEVYEIKSQDWVLFYVVNMYQYSIGVSLPEISGVTMEGNEGGGGVG